MAHKILVVDDKAFMVRLIQHHLERAGYELIKARTPDEANAAIAHEVPNLVLMTDNADTQGTYLPESVIAQTHANIPVIRMTDVPATMSEQKLTSTDEIVFRKPFSPTKLLAEVKRLLEVNPPESVKQ
ncbi:MAG: Response regulator consisting of a CheY-like receiver domain and a winged-helix DNA-binding domain [Verrucomicrobiales bacterium]|nr:Response regulator consisting of a CheY-like receiver domain and a winged-helix DNA-binding domain [Verrucomicrobiales bacterium]